MLSRFCLSFIGSYGGHVLVVDTLKWAKFLRELKASSLKHQDCCFNHPQIWFVEGNVGQQLDSTFLSFSLASWGSPKLKTFTFNVDRQRRHFYWRISSLIDKGSCIHQLKNCLWTRTLCDVVTPVENILVDWLMLSSITSMMHQSEIKHRKHWWIFDVTSMFHPCFRCLLFWNQWCSVY